MIIVRIGASERPLQEVTETWITEQINRRRADRAALCVQVSIREGSLYMTLSTPGCPSAGPTREPTDSERRIFEMWSRLGLDKEDFTGGNLNAFLKQVSRAL